LPDGKELLDQDTLEVSRGTPLAVTGASGVGKSTLFRVVAGIWPFARGHLAQPSGTLMFLPQRPYVPLGTLKRAVVYPKHENEVADQTVQAALEAVGLRTLAENLEKVDNWALRLSGGEQQRLAIARALIVSPDWLFLDEAMSAIEETAVAQLFALLRERLPNAQLVSITHQAGVTKLHPRRIDVSKDGGPARAAFVEDPA
jgi:putative ATP-binding cassette transporter